MAPVLAQQTFAGNALVRGIAGRKLEQILQHAVTSGSALFTLVGDRRVAVVGGGAGGGSTAVRWLDHAGLHSLDLTYTGGEQLHMEGQSTPVYFLGEDVERQSLRLAVDVTSVPAAALEQRQIRLQVGAATCHASCMQYICALLFAYW